MDTKVNKISDDRVMYMDYLRILSTFAVIVIHVAAENWYVSNVNSAEWTAMAVYDSLVRWAVPMFVMISGSLFLDNSRTVTLKNLYSKNILRVATALVFWGALYGIYTTIKYNGGIADLIHNLISGSFHLWFLFMIIGLYIITPLLRKITESKETAKYFIIVSLILTFFIPTIITELNKLDNPMLDAVVSNYNKINFHLTLGYSSYFVMGHYLAKYELSKKFRRIIYLLSVAAIAATMILTITVSRDMQKANSYYLEYLTAYVMLQSVGVFVFAKYNLSKLKLKEKAKKFVVALSKYSFGTYLVHIFILKWFAAFKFDALSFNSALAIPVVSICIFAVSLLISFILNQIPFVKKYFV